MTIRKSVLLAFAAGLTGLVRAEGTAYTAQIAVEGGDHKWTETKWWVNEYSPNKLTDLVSLVPTSGVRTKYATMRLPSVSQPIGAVLDAPEDLSVYFGQSQSSDPIVLQTPTLAGFTNSYHTIGYERAINFRPRNGFEFTGYDGGPSFLPKIGNGWGLWLAVVEGAQALVGEIQNEGVFIKSGAGDLEIATPMGRGTGCYGQGGTLTLGGGAVPVPSDDAPAPGAAFHVDADRIAPEDTVVDGGRTVVTNWADVSGNGLAAGRQGLTGNYAKSSAPWIAEAKAFGHNLLDFGPMRTLAMADGGYGPSCAFKLNKEIKNVREYFAVYEETSALSGAGDSYSAIGWTGTYTFMNVVGTGVYTGYAASYRPIGDLRINGERVGWEGFRGTKSRLFVISESIPESFSVTQNAIIDEIGFERNCACGGFRAGEFLVYTNRLTEAERAQTIAYLMKKWVAGAATAETAAWTLGSVKGTNTAVCVKAGETASVMSWTELGNRPTFRKTGAGTLAVDTVEPAQATVAVEGGAVRFSSARSALPPNPQAAAEPAYRFDASAEGVFTYTGETDGSGNEFISSWSASAGGITADVPTTDSYSDTTVPNIRKPVVVKAGGETGLDVVDFGEAQTNAARAVFSSKVAVREAFVVLKMRNHDSLLSFNSYAGGLGMPFSLDGWYGFANRYPDSLCDLYFATAAVAGGVWTIDGRQMDPVGKDFGRHFSRGTDGFHVYHISFSANANMFALARDCHYHGRGYITGGGIVVGEAIGYARRLTDRECRETEAYLLEKWTTKAHPARTPFAGTLDFTGNAAAEIATDRALELTTVKGAQDIVKSGTGAANVRLLPEVSSLSVSGGALSAEIDPLADAAFHVDASRADTVTFRAGQAADRRIDRWYDCRFNGRYAETPMLPPGQNYGGLTNAVLRTSDGTDGLLSGSSYVDFLDVNAGNNTTNVVSGMVLHDAEGNKSPVAVKEVHAVFRVQSGNAAFIGGELGPSDKALVPRGDAKEIWYGGCTYARDSMKRSDGSDWYADNYFRADRTSATGGFIVLSVQLRGPSVPAHFLAIDRAQCGRGGIKLCELVIFSDATNTTARAEAIHAYLQKKWKGVGEGSAAALPRSLAVAPGASLSLTSSADAFAMDGPADLTCVISADGTCGTLALGSDTALPESATVTVRIPRGAKNLAGRYTFLTASSLTGAANVRNWSVVVEGNTRYFVNLVADGDSVDVILTKPGMSLLVR